MALRVLLVCVLLGLVYAQIPQTFIAKVNSTHPAESTSRVTEYYVDSARGVRTYTVTESFLVPGEMLHEISIFPAMDFSQYLIYPRILGEHMEHPLCFWNEYSFDDPPFIDAAFSMMSARGTVDGDPVDIFTGGEYWWYSYYTSLDVFFPLAWASTRGNEHIVTEFSLETPSTRTFEPPECYPVHAPFLAKRNAPNFVFPDSLKLTFQHLFFNRSIYVDTLKGWSGIRTDVLPLSDLPAFTEYRYYKGDGKQYLWIKWFDITPSPCIWEMQQEDPEFWISPDLTHIGTLRSQGNMSTLTEMYGAGPDIDEVWFFKNSTPVGYLNFEERNPGGPRPVSQYSAGTPPQDFTIPTVCFPRYNGTNYGKRDVEALPVLPPAFTMYVSGVRYSRHESRTIYYDSTKGYTRIDENGFTSLQRGMDVWRFARPEESVLSPPPCVHYGEEPPIWNNPMFLRRVANATVDGKPTGIYSAPLYPGDTVTPLQYWYISSNGMPVYYMHSAFVANRVSYFEASTPPPGVFDVPGTCL